MFSIHMLSFMSLVKRLIRSNYILTFNSVFGSYLAIYLLATEKFHQYGLLLL